MFLREYWYVAAMSGELGRELLARTLLGQPLVLFRTEDGAPVALDDRCPHRYAPLSFGKLVGDAVQGGYHGITFDGSGKCIAIPGQDNIPPRLRVKSYPVVERWRWIWVWMGDPERADEADIPDFHWNDAPGWEAPTDRLRMEADCQLLVDNLLDLTHETFVHGATIGTAGIAEAPIETKADGDVVSVERRMTNIQPPPMFVKLGGFTANIDRWQLIEFRPPANIVIDVGGVPTGAGDRAAGFEARVLNSITPETERSCQYYWAFARNFKIGDEEMTAFLHGALTRTFDEDKALLEAQQKMIESTGSDAGLMAVNFDAGVVQARRVIARLQGEQRAAAAE